MTTNTSGFRAGAAPVIVLAAALLAAPLPARAQHDHDAMVHSGMAAGPQLNLHGFSDVTLHAERDRLAGGADSTSSGFALGQFDLYIASRLADNLSFLGESVFELNESGEGV